MLEHLILIISLLGGSQFGLGTVFGHSSWDPNNPNPYLACYQHRVIDDRDLIVAHPTLPCGSRVWVYNPRTGHSVVALVADRGPRHAAVDLSTAVAKRIGHNGKEPVLLVPLPVRPGWRKLAEPIRPQQLPPVLKVGLKQAARATMPFRASMGPGSHRHKLAQARNARGHRQRAD